MFDRREKRAHNNADAFIGALASKLIPKWQVSGVAITAENSTRLGAILNNMASKDMATMREEFGSDFRLEILGDILDNSQEAARGRGVMVSYASDLAKPIQKAQGDVQKLATQFGGQRRIQGQIYEGTSERGLRRIIGTKAEDQPNFQANDDYWFTNY